MKNKKSLYPYIGAAVLAVIACALLWTAYADDNSVEETVNETDSTSVEEIEAQETERKSQFVMIKQGETRNVTLLELALTLDSIEVLPCGQTQSLNPNTNEIENEQKTCNIRRANIEMIIAKMPTVNENTNELTMDPPQQISFNSVPGFQQTEEHSIQLVEFKDDILRLIIREL